MDVRKLIGQRIKEYRLKKDLTQSQLSEIIGIDAKYMSNIERGRNMPNPNILSNLAEAFGVEIKDLFEYYHLQEPKDLKIDIKNMVDNLDENQLRQTYKYLRAFVL